MKLSTLLIGSAAFVAAFGALEAEASGTPGLRGCPIVPIKVICPPGTYKAMRQNAFNNCPPQFVGCFRKNKSTFRHDEMDDEEVGDDFGRPAHTRPQNPTGQSIMNSIMWDEEDESVGRSCKDFPMAEDCRRLRHKNLHALFSVDDEEDDAYPRSLLNKRRLRRKFKRSFNKRRRRKRTSKKAMKSNMQRNKRRRRKRTSKKAMKSNMQRIHGRPPQTLRRRSDELDDESVGSMGCMGHKRCGDEMDDEAVGSWTMYYPPNHPYHVKRREEKARKAECATKGPRYTWANGGCRDCEKWPEMAQEIGCPSQYWD